MTDDQYRLRLENWIRWARGRDYLPDPLRCSGIESLWRSFDWGEPEEAQEALPTRLGPVEGKDAIIVETTWYKLPEVPRGMLKYALVKAEDPRKTCRRLHMHWKLYDEELYRAALMLRNRLQAPAKSGTLGLRDD